ncbi:MAG: two-component sensor histidine kinase [Actinobacteria bacterium]|nr:two-component sensor histidine kinase [Actinomycetota bacterium]
MQKVAEQQAQDTVADLLDVLATAGLLLNDADVVIRSTNGAQALGLLNNRFLAHPELRDLVQRARQTGEPTEAEVEIQTGLQTGSTWLRARAAMLSDGNVLLTVADETESQRLEETRRDFVANISHELKTPIGAISLLSEALLDAGDDPGMVKKFSADLFKESRRLASLVQDIIQLSRLQGADLIKTATQVDLSGVITDAVERNQVLAERREIKLSWDAPLGTLVLGDSEMLTMAVKNLIENAILYSDNGAQVGVGLREEDGIAQISVTDTGVGIENEHLERIFERFYRADPSRSRETGGTGLGLSIVKHVALNHRGDVQVFSKPGFGSTFTLRLPVSVSQNQNNNEEN